MSIRKADLRNWCANLGISLVQARQATERLSTELTEAKEDIRVLSDDAAKMRRAIQSLQDEATGPSTPPPVGDYPLATECPPAASVGVSWGVSERAEERLIELTREAIRDDLVGRRDARYQGRGPGQLT